MDTPEGYSEGYVAALETVKSMIDQGAGISIIKMAVEEAIESEQQEED